jgi:hypothetical protein
MSATERSTLVVTLTFKDHTGAAVVPTSANWTLTDTRGSVINSRSNVAISPLASTVNIVLTGDDLALTEALDAERVLTVRAQYNSSLGNGLHLSEAYQFTVTELVGVS